MPNWCENYLTIRGAPEAIDRFMAACRAPDPDTGMEADFCFNGIVPQPSGLLDMVGLPSEPVWYRWRLDHWGTKWEPIEVTTERRSPTCMSISFLTAYSPPTSWMATASRRLPALAFTLDYDEPLVKLRGTLAAKAGRLARTTR